MHLKAFLIDLVSPDNSIKNYKIFFTQKTHSILVSNYGSIILTFHKIIKQLDFSSEEEIQKFKEIDKKLKHKTLHGRNN